MKYKIYSLGCKVNQYDGDKLGGLLKSAGFISAKNGADLAIINTCAVTGSAIGKSRVMIKKARQENPRAKIILSGCLPKICEKNFIKQAEVDLIMSANDFKIKKIEKLFLNSCLPDRQAKFKIQNSKSLSADKCLVFPRSNENRSRYFLKVQDGCEQFCSYCIIPYTRGKLQSRPLAEVVAEAEAAVKKGYREIVLCGIHLGLFGVNNVDKNKRERGATLIKLLRELARVKDLRRTRLSSIEVTEIGDELINFMAREKRMCQHLHIPLQSGCDKILRLMKRPYDLKFFAAKIRKLRKKMPDIALSTDVIVGFPGETDKDFSATEKFIRKMKFSRLHVFPYSPHSITAASKLPGRVKPEIIKGRSEILRKLSDRLFAAYQKKFVGKILEVVVEQNRSSRTGKLKGRKLKGKTQYYFDVYFDRRDIVGRAACLPDRQVVRTDFAAEPDEDLIGQVLKIKIKHKEANVL